MDIQKHIETLDKQRLNYPTRFYALLVSMQIDGQLRETVDGRYLLSHALDMRKDELALHLIAGTPLGNPDDTGNYFIHQAIENRCQITLRALVGCGLSLEALSWTNETAMMIAVRKDDIAMLDVIEELDPDCCLGRAYEDDNFIHYAAIHGAVNAIDWLVERGVDVNEKNYLGRTPIFYATTIPVIDALARCGADFSVTNYQGESIEQHMRGLVYQEAVVKHIDVARANQLKHRIGYAIRGESANATPDQRRRM